MSSTLTLLLCQSFLFISVILKNHQYIWTVVAGHLLGCDFFILRPTKLHFVIVIPIENSEKYRENSVTVINKIEIFMFFVRKKGLL